MSLIDQITSANELQSIRVPEWEDTDCAGEVYFKPFTLADADWCTKMAKGKDGEFIAYCIIRKCLNTEGNPLFTIGDKQKLMRGVNPDLLSRIVVEMKGEDEELGK